MVVAAGRCQRSRSIGDLPVLALGMAESSTNCASSDAGEAPNSCTTRRRAPRPLSGRASLTRFRHSRRRRRRPGGQESHNRYAQQVDRDQKRQVIFAGGVEYQPGHDRPCHQRKHHRRSCPGIQRSGAPALRCGCRRPLYPGPPTGTQERERRCRTRLPEHRFSSRDSPNHASR